MTSTNEFKSITDNFVSALYKANEEINAWAVSETGLFLREISADARIVMEQPERAGANLRDFVRDNPEAVLTFSAGCLTLFKVMAQKRPRKPRKAAKKPATVSFHEAVIDGYEPSPTDEIVLAQISQLVDDARKELRTRTDGSTLSADDGVLWGYLVDLSDRLVEHDLSNARLLVRVMTASTVGQVREFARMTEEWIADYMPTAENPTRGPQPYLRSPLEADPDSKPAMTTMMQVLIDLPYVTFEDRSCGFSINESDRAVVIDALRTQVSAELEAANKAVEDYPTQGDKAAVSWLSEIQAALVDPVDLYVVVSVIDRMGTTGVSSLGHEANQRLLQLLSGWDR